jgi:hypothetical protein
MSRGRPALNVVMSASACTLRIDVHDNFAGQDRRTLPATMGGLLAPLALNVNQRKPAIQALRRGVVPPMSRSRRTPNVVMSASACTLRIDVHDNFARRLDSVSAQ